MKTMTPEYLTLLEEKHATDASWGNTSGRYLETVESLLETFNCQTVLDYGCGKGVLLTALRDGITAIGYDPAIPKFSRKPEMVFDMAICTDVMEHVEEEFVAGVLSDVKQYAGKVAYFMIACYPAQHTLSDGRNTHVTIKPPEWWIAQIEDAWGGSAKVDARHTDFEVELLVLMKG